MIVASTNEYDIAVIAIVLPMLVAVVWIVAHQWRKTRVAAYNARLKQLMIERGMSADEIERVLRAGGQPAEGRRSRRHVILGVGGGLNPGCCTGDADIKRTGS
jgi:hypothetical protein